MKQTLVTIVAIAMLLATSCTSSGSSNDTLRNEEPETNPYATIVEDFDLLMPSGNRVHGMIRRPNPALYPNQRFAAVVMVPGGTGAGRLAAQGIEAKMLAEAEMGLS